MIRRSSLNPFAMSFGERKVKRLGSIGSDDKEWVPPPPPHSAPSVPSPLDDDSSAIVLQLNSDPLEDIMNPTLESSLRHSIPALEPEDSFLHFGPSISSHLDEPFQSIVPACKHLEDPFPPLLPISGHQLTISSKPAPPPPPVPPPTAPTSVPLLIPPSAPCPPPKPPPPGGRSHSGGGSGGGGGIHYHHQPSKNRNPSLYPNSSPSQSNPQGSSLNRQSSINQSYAVINPRSSHMNTPNKSRDLRSSPGPPGGEQTHEAFQNQDSIFPGEYHLIQSTPDMVNRLFKSMNEQSSSDWVDWSEVDPKGLVSSSSFPVSIHIVKWTLELSPSMYHLKILSRDSVTVAVDAVVYFRISNATVSVSNVEDYARSTRLLAATTLRNVLGTKNLSEILSERESISHIMQVSLDEATDPWGVKVERVEIKDVRLPVQLQRAMAAEAEATREARAKVIAAEGEQRASRALRNASEVISDSPVALQLRYLQTLGSIATEKNSTIVFPIPLELFKGYFNSPPCSPKPKGIH